jgi:hypothetical protein
MMIKHLSINSLDYCNTFVTTLLVVAAAAIESITGKRVFKSLDSFKKIVS